MYFNKYDFPGKKNTFTEFTENTENIFHSAPLNSLVTMVENDRLLDPTIY